MDIKLLKYAKNSDIKNLELLFNNGIDVNKKFFNGTTALMIASFYGKVDAVKYLYGKGASLDLKDDFGNNALTFAKLSKNKKIINFLS